ncbi:hypothetical protein [Thermomonas sp.]|uniref:hypothetical protein n=1 Tax=Thermomonas sp. TaxID=1971895 RepID=UPI0035AE9EF5
MSRRKPRVLTDRERGARMALQAATDRLHQLSTETQRDLFVSRRALLAEWMGIRAAARLALA